MSEDNKQNTETQIDGGQIHQSPDNRHTSSDTSAFWGNLSDTIVIGAMLAGACYTIVSKYGKDDAFQAYSPYFLGAVASLPVVRYLNHDIIKPGIEHLAKQVCEEETAIAVAGVTSHVFNTLVGSAMISSAIRMLGIQEEVVRDNCLYDILAKSIACGALPKFCGKLTNGDLDNMSHDTLIAFMNQFVRKGVKGILDNSHWLPYEPGNKLIGAVAASLTKGIMVKQKGMDIFQNIGFNVLNTFVYDVTNAKHWIKAGLAGCEELMGCADANEYSFVNDIITMTITESSELYVDSLALSGVYELLAV